MEAMTSPLPLASLVVVLSGDFDGLTRAAAQEAVTALGGTLGSSVTAKTSLLVAGARSGAKSRAAAAKQIPVMSGAHFVLLAADASRGDLVAGALAGPADDDIRAVSAAADGQSRRAEHSARRAHDDITTTGSPDGVWTVWSSCVCTAWSIRCGTVAEAREAHRTHRAEFGLGPVEPR